MTTKALQDNSYSHCSQSQQHYDEKSLTNEMREDIVIYIILYRIISALQMYYTLS